MLRPTRNAAATRERLLDCARGRFLRESYESVGLRDIAGDAGVDVALVRRYFGSKEQLFKAVLRGRGSGWIEDAAKFPDLGGYLARLVVEKQESEGAEHLERLLIILRSASSPQAAALVRTSFREDVLQPIAALLSGPNAEMRAGLALSVLMGTTIVRTIMNLEVLHRCDRTDFERQLRELLNVALGDRN